MCYSYRRVLKITIHIFHFEPFNHTCADDEKFTPISDNLTVRTVSWHCPLNFFFIFLQETVIFFYLINVLDFHKAVDYCKSLARQSDSSSSTGYLLFNSIDFSSICFFFMCFVLGDGSSHSLIAWNAFGSPLN